MLSSLATRFRPFVWFLIFCFTISSTPHIELLFPYAVRLVASDVHAAEASSSDVQIQDENVLPDTGAPGSAGTDGLVQADAVPGRATSSESPGGAGVNVGSADMSPFTGAVSTSIPIEVPPGRKGMSPRLALKYNSYQKSGWVGMGWTLDMGSIQRSTKYGVRYDDNGGYVATIDGASVDLVLVDQTNKIYRARIEGSNSRYQKTSSGWIVTALDGTTYYYGYRSEANSRQDFVDGSVTNVFKWALDLVVDPNGNYMLIDYWKPGDGNIYLKEIDYAGNGSTGPTNRVLFQISDRDAGNNLYASDGDLYNTNYKVTPAWLLTSIKTQTKSGGAFADVRTYNLAYMHGQDSVQNPGSPRWLLQTVTQQGSDGTSLPQTVFSYTQLPPPVPPSQVLERFHYEEWPASLYTHDQTRRNFVGDFNGDGRSDIVSFVYGSNGKYVAMQLARADGSGFDTTYWGTSDAQGNPLPISDPPPDASAGWMNIAGDAGGNAAIWLGDFNGDGMTDLATIAGNGAITIYISTGTNFMNNGSTGWTSERAYNNSSARVRVGDFNGDGISDIISFTTKNIAKVFISTYTPSAPSNYTFYANTNVHCEIMIDANRGPLVWVGDFNGDGISDIAAWVQGQAGKKIRMHFGTPNTPPNAFTFSINGTSPGNDWSSDLLYDSNQGPVVWLGDFNGDGKTDMAAWESGSGGNYLRMHISTGSNFAPADANHLCTTGGYTPCWATNPALYWDYTTGAYAVWVADVNGDGRTDILSWNFLHSGGENINVFYANGNNGFTSEVWGGMQLGQFGSPLLASMMVGDFNGDGRSDLVTNKWNSGGGTVRMNTASGPFPELLSTINNGIGGITTLEYQPSSYWWLQPDGADHWWQMPFILQTLHTKAVSDGRGNVTNSQYEYANGFFYGPERDFRGFGTAVTYLMRNDGAGNYETKTEANFIQHDPIQKGMISSQIVTSWDGHSKKTENTWGDNGQNYVLYSYPPGSNTCNTTSVCFPPLKSTKGTDIDPGADPFVAQTDYAYESYTTTGGWTFIKLASEYKYGRVPAEDIVTHFLYDNNYGKPTDIAVTNAGGSIQSRKWMDYFDNGNLRLEQMCSSLNPATDCQTRNTDRDSTVSYTYYTNGNPLTITDSKGCTTTMDYDTDSATYVFHTTNCRGHVTTTTYDAGIGKLKTMKPPYLGTSDPLFTYTYDKLGRIWGESRPDGGSTTYDYTHAYTGPTSQYVLKQEHISAPGSSTVYLHESLSYYDGLGRTWAAEITGSPDQDGPLRDIFVVTQYNSLGRVVAKSNPYFSDASLSYWTTYDHDGLSRVTRVTAPNGTHVDTIHKGACKDVINPRGFSTSYCYDPFQRLREVTDANDPQRTTTNYVYDILGNLTQVSRPNPQGGAITTTMTYDSLSKKRGMNDPDMGLWSYFYDKAGNLTCQKDAKGQVIAFIYDNLNRVTQKDLYAQAAGLECTNYQAFNSTDTITYVYDTISQDCAYATGKLIDVSALSNSTLEVKKDTVLACDNMQRITKSRKSIGPQGNPNPVSTTIAKAYDTAGRMTSLTYFPGDPIREKRFTYAYDDTLDSGQHMTAGNLAKITNSTAGNTIVKYSGYNELNKQTKAIFSKADSVTVETDYMYDPAMGRLSRLITGKYTGQTPMETYQDLQYQFDDNGNTSLVIDGINSVTHTYVYDALDRLTSAVGTGAGGYSQTYSYDILGNITCKSDVASSDPNYQCQPGNPVYTYIYGNKPHAVRNTTGYVNVTMDYDANGNMISRRINGGPLTAITWTVDNKPATIGNTTYTYDGNGQRVKKSGGGATTTLYFGELYEERGGTPIFHIFAGSTRVMSIRPDGNQTYHGNHLNSATVITDDNGDQKQKIEYYPFGTYRYTTSPQLGTYDFSSAFPNVNYTFTDQEYDDESGLYNYKGRIYDPLLGRFISPDSVVPEPGNLQAFNRYSYCVNNPVTYVDPSGHFFGIDDLIYAIYFCIILAAGYMGYTQAQANGQNPWVGALIGSTIAAASMVVGAGIGGAITTGIGASSTGSMFVANTIGAMAGGFAGGAVAGAANAQAFGGNVQQAALYGGLIGAAVAGTIAGAVELGGWANGTAPTAATHGQSANQVQHVPADQWCEDPQGDPMFNNPEIVDHWTNTGNTAMQATKWQELGYRVKIQNKDFYTLDYDACTPVTPTRINCPPQGPKTLGGYHLHKDNPYPSIDPDQVTVMNPKITWKAELIINPYKGTVVRLNTDGTACKLRWPQ